jgi:hypothetical protein
MPLPDETENSPQQKRAKALPVFIHFRSGERNEMDLDGELVGLGHLLPTWQHTVRLACRLPMGQH